MDGQTLVGLGESSAEVLVWCRLVWYYLLISSITEFRMELNSRDECSFLFTLFLRSSNRFFRASVDYGNNVRTYLEKSVG